MNYDYKIILDKVNELFCESLDEVEKVRIAFEYVQDEISHS